MNQHFLKLLLSSFIFFIITQSSAQNLSIKTKQERIKINNDTTYSKDVSVLLNKSSKAIAFPIFYDQQLEEVSNIKVYLKKGKRFKQNKTPYIKEDKLELDYITSKKVKSILIPPDTEAKVTYNVNCIELMYFADLSFFSYNEIDTLKYQISIPKTFSLSHNIINRDSLNYLSIDSVSYKDSTNWTINVTPIKVKHNPLMYFGIYKNLKAPLMRTIVVPIEYRNKEKAYMNNWYLQKVKTKRGLDSTAIRKIDELTKGLSDKLEITKVLYNYVRNNFKYVAIEIGMGAFVPTHVNEVFKTKQGDCKDLSNFLSEALNYKGVTSDIALAATFDHITDCDFPSLGSANHVVCVASPNDEYIILDPTDPVHVPLTPVQSIQERTVLIVNSKDGAFYKIEKFSPEQNEIFYDIELKANSSEMLMDGSFKTNYKGISGNYLRYKLLDSDKKEQVNILKELYKPVFNNQTVNKPEAQIDNNGVIVEGKISVDGKIFNDESSSLVFIDFLPALIETESRETLLEGTYIGNPFLKKVRLKIKLDKQIETFKPILHNIENKGVNLKVEITNPTNTEILCNYTFLFDYIFIKKSNASIINDILKSFKKIINEPIIIKNKL